MFHWIDYVGTQSSYELKPAMWKFLWWVLTDDPKMGLFVCSFSSSEPKEDNVLQIHIRCLHWSLVWVQRWLLKWKGCEETHVSQTLNKKGWGDKGVMLWRIQEAHSQLISNTKNMNLQSKYDKNLSLVIFSNLHLKKGLSCVIRPLKREDDFERIVHQALLSLSYRSLICVPHMFFQLIRWRNQMISEDSRQRFQWRIILFLHCESTRVKLFSMYTSLLTFL